MVRSFRELPTGSTEVSYVFSPRLGRLGFLLKYRARKRLDETVNEDLKALDALATRVR